MPGETICQFCHFCNKRIVSEEELKRHPSRTCFLTKVAFTWDKCPIPDCTELFETVSQVMNHLTEVHQI